jgi:hypothetical protein
MSMIIDHICDAAAKLPEGGLLSPKDFLHLGSRAAIDQSFYRLAQNGKVARIGQGLYTVKVKSRFGERLPSTEKVLEALAGRTGETIVPQEAVAANLLGLSTQIPMYEIFLTSGRSRKLRFGRQTVILRQAPRWMLLLGHRQGGVLIRALAWLGAEQAPLKAPELVQKIPAAELEAVAAVRSELPDWMARTIGNMNAYA